MEPASDGAAEVGVVSRHFHARLTPKLVPAASELVFYVLTANAELSTLLNQTFSDLRAGLRQAYRANKESDFTDAIQNLRRDLTRAEASIERGQTLVSQISRTLTRLS